MLFKAEIYNWDYASKYNDIIRQMKVFKPCHI